MKTILKTVFFILLISSITSCRGVNNDKTIHWIEKAQKPIICKLYGENVLGERFYTLFSADGRVYATGRTQLLLPDTLKLNIK